MAYSFYLKQVFTTPVLTTSPFTRDSSTCNQQAVNTPEIATPSSCSFFSLPLELRLMVYKHLLISKEYIIPYSRNRHEARQDLANVNSNILLTCKQIHSEAAGYLYSGNRFMIFHPEGGREWLSQIGPVNRNLFQCLSLGVDSICGTPWQSRIEWTVDVSSWHTLLAELSWKADGLKYLQIYWDSTPISGHYGAGRDQRFVLNLAMLKGLRHLELGGTYSKVWPEYLRKVMPRTRVVETKDRLKTKDKSNAGGAGGDGEKGVG